jgi:hypothetical protein
VNDARWALPHRFWIPAAGHPDGAGDRPAFEVVGSMVYPEPDGRGPDWPEPAARGAGPWYQYRGDLVYAVAAHPSGPSPVPWFLARGPWILRWSGDRDVASTAPWFEARP